MCLDEIIQFFSIVVPENIGYFPLAAMFKAKISNIYFQDSWAFSTKKISAKQPFLVNFTLFQIFSYA